MCIRDRFQLVILFGQLFHIHLAVREFSGQLASGGVELFLFRFMLCLVPVSYTHLDVYKRQANPVLIHSLKRYAVLRRMGLPVALCLSDKGIYPVSYTHLDVYKRQANSWCPALNTG